MIRYAATHHPGESRRSAAASKRGGGTGARYALTLVFLALMFTAFYFERASIGFALLVILLFALGLAGPDKLVVPPERSGGAGGRECPHGRGRTAVEAEETSILQPKPTPGGRETS